MARKEIVVNISGFAGVVSLNSLVGAVTLSAGAGISLSQVGNDIEISAASMGSVSIGDTIGAGTAPAVLFLDGTGQLAQDPTNFRHTPGTLGRWRLTDGGGNTSVLNLSPFGSQVVTTDGVEESQLVLASNNVSLGYQNLFTSAQSLFTADPTQTYESFNDNFSGAGIKYNNLVGVFIVGETITGGTSGATGEIVSDNGSQLIITNIVGGPFTPTEVITGGTSGATADAVKYTPIGAFSGIIGVIQDVSATPFTSFITIDKAVGGINIGDPSYAQMTVTDNATSSSGIAMTLNLFSVSVQDFITPGGHQVSVSPFDLFTQANVGAAVAGIAYSVSPGLEGMSLNVSDGTNQNQIKFTNTSGAEEISIFSSAGLAETANLQLNSGSSTPTAVLGTADGTGVTQFKATSYPALYGASVQSTDGVSNTVSTFWNANTCTVTLRADDGTNQATFTLNGDSTPSGVLSVTDGTGLVEHAMNLITFDHQLSATNGTSQALLTLQGDATPVFTSLVDNGTLSSTFTQTPTGFAMTDDLTVPDEAFGVAWNASLEVPTKNAIFDIFATATPSGFYSPTVSAVSGITGTPTITARYMRIGNFVQVSGTFFANANSGTASFEATLPFASNFSTSDLASGSLNLNGAVTASPTESGTVLAEPTNDTFRFEWQASGLGSQTYTWQAMYQII